MTVSISNMSQVWMTNANTYNAVAMSVSTLGYGANINSKLLNLIVDGDRKFSIDAVGRISIPYQPMFYAYAGTITTSTGPFVFGSTRINVGGHYNTTNGRFTAPVAGNYAFFGHGLHRGNGGTGNVELTFYKNGSNINTRGMSYSIASQSAGHIPCQTTVILPLVAGDYVQYGASAIGSPSDVYLPENLSHFSGYLIG